MENGELVFYHILSINLRKYLHDPGMVVVTITSTMCTGLQKLLHICICKVLTIIYNGKTLTITKGHRSRRLTSGLL